MSDPTGRSPKSSRNPKTLPGDSGSESGRKDVGKRHGYKGDGTKKYGPGTGKNQGDGTGT